MKLLITVLFFLLCSELFAQKNKVTPANFLKAHVLLSKHLLLKSKQGKYRTVNMVVMEHKTRRIQCEAALV